MAPAELPTGRAWYHGHRPRAPLTRRPGPTAGLTARRPPPNLRGLSEFLQQLLNGLSLGAIYALIALGYTMVYGVLRFINFAHADLFMVGAFLGYFGGRLVPAGTLVGGLGVLALAMAGCAVLVSVVLFPEA